MTKASVPIECGTYSNTVMCVSDGRTRAIRAAVRSPSWLLDKLMGNKKILSLMCALYTKCIREDEQKTPKQKSQRKCQQQTGNKEFMVSQ